MILQKSILTISIFTLASCGLIKPSDDKKDSEQASEQDENKDDEKNGATLTVTETVKFKHEKKFDFLVLRENSNRLTETNPSNNNTYRYEPFIARLYEAEETPTPQLYDLLTGELYAAKLDVKLGVLDAMHTTATENSVGSLLGDENNENHTFNLTKAGSPLDAKPRLNHRSAQTFTSSANFFPKTSLFQFLEKSKNAYSQANPSGGFLRKDAKLVILYSHFMDDVNDTLNVQDIAQALDSRIGKGRWIFNVAGIPKDGCYWKLDENDTNELEKHTDADQSAANIADAQIEDQREDLEAYLRRDNLKNLMSVSNGAFLSLCDGNVQEFTEDLVNRSIRPTYYDIPLKKLADFETIVVKIGKNELKDYIYSAKQKSIKIKSSYLSDGEKVTVSFVEESESKKDKESSSKGDEKVDKLGEKILTPAELAFTTEGIREAFAENCNGCHGNRYNSFQYTFGNKNAAFMRITNADNPMPPGDPDFMNSEAGLAIIDWINSY